MQVRDAAQSILQSELRRIGSEGRKKIIADWLPYLPRSQAAAGLGNPRVAMKTTSFSDESKYFGFLLAARYCPKKAVWFG